MYVYRPRRRASGSAFRFRGRDFNPNAEGCNPFNNPAGNGPCGVEDFCFELGTTESIQCVCTTIDYFLDEACGVCANDQPQNWSSYAEEFNCGNEPSAMPNLPTTIPVPPSDESVIQPVTFDAKRAVSLADSSPPTPVSQSASSASATAVALAQSQSSSPTHGSSRSSMSSVQSTASSGPSSSSTSTDGPSSLPAPTSPSGSQHHGLPTAAIIGIVVGSILFLSLTLLLCRYCRRRRSPIAAGSLQHLDASESPREEHDTSTIPPGPHAEGTIRPYSVFYSNIPATAGYGGGKFNSPVVPPIAHPFHPFKSFARPADVDFQSVSGSPPDHTTVGRLRKQIAAQEARIQELESRTQMTLTLPPLLRDDAASGVSIPTTGRLPPMYSDGGRGSIL
ncbi:hypothetical protein FB45DRAFT_1086366 [Roridomyces roridus]|uniref:Extracellular membrane protein CFEM domain-containing protein n=1 Tax=Roridomyces roridus TaxID=1738132 RepID=A0AAD7BL99_9AGAR|nr:hypothetical protein FB45DRAFT_1086366 [Roridomyces roridus]